MSDQKNGDQVDRIRVRAAQIRQLYDQSIPGLGVGIAVSIITATALWNVTEPVWLVAWLSLFLPVQAIRLFSIIRFRKTRKSLDDEKTQLYGKFFFIGSFITAALWGGAGLSLYPPQSMPHQFLVVAVIAGAGASLAWAHAPLRVCYISSVILTVVPLSLRLLIDGHSAQLAMGIMGILYTGALLVSGKSAHSTITNSIRLRFEKDSLLEEVSKSRDWLEREVAQRTEEFRKKNDELTEEIDRREHVEIDLRESEERYRTLFLYSRDAINIASEDGELIDFNEAFLDVFGYSSDQMKSKNAIDLWAEPEDRSRWQERLKCQGHVIDYEMKALRRDGETRDCLLTTTVRSIPGGVTQYQTILRDVTEQKKGLRALGASEARYRDLFENAGDAIYTQDLRGNFTSAYRAAEKLLGAKRERLLTLNIRDVVHPDDVREAQENLTRKTEKREASTGPYEIRIRGLDGAERWVEVTTRLVTRDGGSEEILGVARDVTERKLAQEALRESEERYRDLVDLLPQPVFEMNADGKLTYVSSKGFELFGYSREDFERGVDFSELLSPQDLPRALQNVQKVMKGEIFEARDYTALRKDGTSCPVLVHSVPIRKGARVKGLRGIVVDMTARQKAEEALRRVELLYRSVVDNIEDVFYRSDKDGKLLIGSPSGARLFGYESIDEMIGLPLDSLWVHPQEHQRLISKVKHAGKVKDFEGRLKRKDGSTFVASFTTHFYRDESGAIQGTQGIIRDVTERKKIEKAIESIVAGVSGKIGERFFESSVVQFAGILNADFTLIGNIVEREQGRFVKTMAFCGEGQIQENFEYALKGAPCEIATEVDICTYPIEVARKFPEDELLRQMKIEGYVGIGLRDSRGHPMGIMAAMYQKPIENVKFAESVLQIFASRATAEIERKRAEEALSDSEATLRTLLQAAPIGIGQVSSDRVLGWTNRVLCTMLGYSREELAGKNAKILYESEEEYLRVGREKHPEVIRRGWGSVETRFKRKDGTVFDVLLSSSAVVPGDLSQGLVFTALDITEQKRAEQELRRLGAAVEQAGETIVVTDRKGSILYVNPAFEQATGYAREEILGQNPRILKSGKQDRDFYGDMWETLIAGKIWRGKFTNKNKAGQLFEETATISPIKDEHGQIINYVAVKRDVTEESMLQKQLLHAQKMEAIGTLAGGIAHDFNNLLQAIVGYADLLLIGNSLADVDRKKVEIIHHAARDGADLASSILAFSRKAESKARPIDLNQEILRIEKLLLRTLPKMVELKLELQDDLMIINADPTQIEQVVLNLAVNALHAMPDGGRLLLRTKNISSTDDYLKAILGPHLGQFVLLTISDTGAGIEPQLMDRIFEPFFTTKTDGQGTGLGLAMVDGIVSQHGGYIRCHSEPGTGTSFKIYFPVSALELISDPGPATEMPTFGTETVLLVDDDDRVRKMAMQMIEMGGYRIIPARNGEEALENYDVHKHQIALVILDLIMPGMGGKRCLKELLRLDPRAKVIVASGYSSDGLSSDANLAGARGFMSKPYDARSLLAAIRKVLDEGSL